MKAIHHHIFQDVYEWAGQERVAPLGTFMVKSGPDVVHYQLGDPAAPQMSYQYYPAGPVLGRQPMSIPQAQQNGFVARLGS